jgi:hypothetical protein
MPRKPEPPSPTWDVFKIAKKSIWLGTVEATDATQAIENGAEQFRQLAHESDGGCGGDEPTPAMTLDSPSA